jgi:hypothetical protein
MPDLRAQVARQARRPLLHGVRPDLLSWCLVFSVLFQVSPTPHDAQR